MSMVIKVGGSLFPLPDFASRLKGWLELQAPSPLLIVPGGGSAADVVRAWDGIHKVGEKAAHWLALRMLQVNAHFMAALLPSAPIVAEPSTPASLAILDAFAFAEADEASPHHLPHVWSVTSDSVAARAARVAGACELVLLKSVEWAGEDWHAAAQAGVVDACFPDLLRPMPALRVRVVNLREWRPA